MKNLHHILFFLTLLLIFISLFFSGEMRNLVFKNTQIDTIGHFIGFFCLSWVMSSFIKLPLKPTFIALCVYAALSEIGQHYLGYRNGEIKDFVADILGIVVFMILKWCYLVYWKKTPQ